MMPYMLIAISLAVLLLFTSLGLYSYPSSDDFCMASGVNKLGLVRQLWEHYFEWSGRYSGNALYAVYPLVFGLFDGYKYIPVLVILALFLATAFLLSSLFKVRFYARPVLLSSLCFVSIYLLGMMSPASGLYWMAGALTYQSANILLLLVLGLVIRLADRQKRSKKYTGLLSVLLLLVVITIGTNETSMLAITAIAMLGAVLHLRSAWDVQKPWIIILIISLACFAIVYFSPGNDIRAAGFPLRHDLLRSINGSLAVGSKILWLWISNPVLIFSSLLAPFVIAALFKSSSWRLSGSTFAVSHTMIISLLCCTFIMPFLLQFPAWWSMGGWPPARTVDTIYFLFLLSWYLMISAVTVRYLLMGKWQSIAQPYRPGTTAVLVLLTVLFTVAVLQSKSYRLARADLLHHARPYHEYLSDRYGLIEQAMADGQHHLTVPDYQQEHPHSIYFNDILHNQDDWRNDCYAEYFGLEKIKRQKVRRAIER
jgi:hypothetical protein